MQFNQWPENQVSPFCFDFEGMSNVMRLHLHMLEPTCVTWQGFMWLVFVFNIQRDWYWQALLIWILKVIYQNGKQNLICFIVSVTRDVMHVYGSR